MKNYKNSYMYSLTVRSTILLLILLAVICPHIPSYASDAVHTVISVEVMGLSRITDDEFLDMMCIQAGDEFNAEVLRRCIRRVFVKNIFLDIQVDTELSDKGITLKYIVKEVPVVKEIRITGNRELSNRKIRRVIPFEEGDDFRENLLSKAGENIKDYYIKNGFFDVSLRLSSDHIEDPLGVIVRVDIDEGKPMVIKSINMPEDALKRVSIYSGQVVDVVRLEKELNKLKEHYIDEGYMNPVIGPYELTDGVLHVPVNPGARLFIEFSENAVFSNKKLLKEMPFMDNGMVTDELIEEAALRLKDLYLSKGYYYVQVAAGLETTENDILIKFMIFEGRRVKLRKVSFKGTSINSDVLNDIVRLQENDSYNDRNLESGIDSLEGFYNALGYINMNVSSVEKEFNADGTLIDLLFDIQEQAQVRITEINISGNRDLSLSEVKGALRLRRNIPFNLLDIGDSRHRLLSLYKRYGYVDASVEIESKVNGSEAAVYFKIIEGPPSVIGKVMIRGDRKTKEKIIRREFTLKEGAPYNHDELLKIKQRIYKLGLFNEVTINELYAEEHDYRTVRDVLISVDEEKPGSVEVALGYGDYEQFRTSLDLSYRNLGGYDREASIRGEFSAVEKRYTINFIEPWLFNKPNLPFSASLIKEDKENVNIDTRDVLYKIDRLSAIVGIEKELSSGLKANINYEYSVNKTTDVDPGVILSKEDTGSIAIGSVSASMFYDTRNNPFDPSSGAINGVVFKFASKAFLSQVEFIKGTLQSSWFYQLRKGVVLAASFKGGASYTYEKEDELPLVERFFLGGRTTVRGYSHDNLGPKGADDVPTGGNVFALINQELRLDIGKGVGLVLFVDGGNIWHTTKDIDNKLLFTVGGGLRYNTPVGPVRIDYGHKLDRGDSESAGEIHFSFGHAF